MKRLYVKKRKMIKSKKEKITRHLKKILSPRSLINLDSDEIKKYITDPKKVSYIRLKMESPNLQEYFKNKLRTISISKEYRIIIGFYGKKITLSEIKKITNILIDLYRLNEIIFYIQKVNYKNKMTIIITK